MKYTREELQQRAWRNIIINITGESKSGKTHLAVRSSGPRYIAYLDRNTALAYQLLNAEKEGFPYELVEVEEILPVPYESLTVEMAEEYVRKVEVLASRAIREAVQLGLQGLHGGTFIVDGALILKGYIEKWKLGESSTLGYRAKRGDRGVSQIQYAESNAYFNDFVGRFAGQNIDLILTWEGRRVWEEYFDDNGSKQRRATNRFRSSGPESMSFAINAEVQTLVEAEDVVVNNRLTGEQRFKHKVLIGYNAFNTNLRGKKVKIDSFNELKELFLGDVVPPESTTPEVVEAVE